MANERVWSLATIGEFWNKVKNLVSGYKPKQTAVSDPSASGTGVAFIDSISQNANGVITPTKKTVRTMGAASSSAAGSTGLVPAPAAGKQSQFLRGDGTWNTPTDTKNTAGSTDSSSKLFLIGATSQGANPQTYSQDTTYIGTDGCLYSNNKKVLTDHQDISGKKNTQTAVSDPSASGTGITFIDSISQNAQGVINPTKKTVRNSSQSQSGLMSSTDKKKLDELAGDTLPVTSGAATTMKEYVDDFSIEMVPEYDDEETYAIGDYSQHEELVYRCKVPITIAESWNSEHWERANIAEELAKANAIRDDIGVVVNGNTASQNVTSGQYVIVRNSTISEISDGLYKASANVAAGTAFTSANLTAVLNGAANSLQSQVTSLSKQIGTKSTTLTSANSGIFRQSIRKSGNVVYVFVGISEGVIANTDFAVGTLPEGYRPNVLIQMPGTVTSLTGTTPIGNVYVLINTDGTIIVNSTAAGYVAFAVSFVI